MNVGIIGLGVGEAHISGYLSHPACKVTYLCDFSEEVKQQMLRKYPNIKFTTKAEDILHDTSIDIVTIASYDNYHYEQLVMAIENNKHIFIEKPLCLFEEEASHIRELLRKKPEIKISSNLILRKTPRFIYLKELIDKGKLGDLFLVEGDYNYGRIHKITEGWRGKIPFYSVIYGGAIHIIDLLLWLTGDTVEEVSAYGTKIATKDTQFKYNDTVISILKFKSGMIAKVSSNFSCVFPHFHTLSMYGTKATFMNGLKNGLIFNARDPEIEPEVIDKAYPGSKKGDLIFNFIESILNNKASEVTTDEVFSSMSVCFAIEKAVKENRSVKVNYI